MQITNQKRIAARLLKCGVNRVYINPAYHEQVAGAVQTDDIREFIDEGHNLCKTNPRNLKIPSKSPC